MSQLVEAELPPVHRMPTAEEIDALTETDVTA